MELTTIDACQIAGIPRQRFNEYVAAGDYPCAPATVMGKARRFTVNDTVCLYLFAREIEGRTKAIIAVMIAGAVHRALNDNPNAAACTLAKLSDGRPIALVPADTSISDQFDGAWIVSLTTINLAAVRKVVEAQATEDTEAGEFVAE